MRKLFFSKNLKKFIVFNIGIVVSVGVCAQQLTVNLTPSNVNCQGLRNGQVTANVTGGTPPYTYYWSNGASTQSLSNLNPGYFHCKVVDNNNVGGEAEITLTEPEVLRIVQYDATVYSNNFNTSCYSCNDGAITVSVAGGTPPYSYAWSDGSTQQNRINLIAKDYQLVVTDAFGCQVRELNKELSKPERDDWTANGNNNANTNSFIGTTNNFPLVFKAFNNEGFRLLPDGKFGVGTSTPTEKFEVNGGNVKFSGDLNVNGNFKLSNLSSTSSGVLKVGLDGTFSKYDRDELLTEMYRPVDCSLIGTNQTVNDAPHWSISPIYTTGNGGMVSSTPSSYFSKLISCYNVGIKNPNPAHELDVNGEINGINYFKNGYAVEFSQWVTNTANTSTNEISFAGNLVNITDAGSILTFKAHNPFGQISSSSNKIDFYTSGGTWNELAMGKINVHGDAIIDGKFIIGSANIQSDAKLAIAGNVKAYEITVDNTWSDFVFDDDYKLTPLLDVEKYLTENNHLEGIPAASEIEKNGLPLGELVKLQMQKIEELTLYTIELQKQVNELKLEVKK